MIKPNTRQALVLTHVEEGESVVVSGPARSGKTALSHLLWETFERVALLTANRAEAERTGLGYAPRWSGRTRRWRAADVVVIDEAHLLNRDQLDRLDQEAKTARNNQTAPFGGAAVVLLVDRYQCSKRRYSLDRSEAYRAIPHRVRLSSVFGVHAPTAKKLFRWRRGKLDLMEARREHALSMVPCRLTTPHGAALMNSSVFQKLNPVVVRAFAALTESSLEDPTSTTEVVTTIDACFPYQTILTLCVGARVVLLCDYDLSRGLRAGLKGTITAFTEDLPFVFFENSVGEVIERVSWSVPRHPAVHRLQVPLRLAWAVSYMDVPAHSLTAVTFDPADFHQRELYCALSRCADLESVRFISACPPPV